MFVFYYAAALQIVCSINRAGLSIGEDQSPSAQVENIYSKEVNNAYF